MNLKHFIMALVTGKIDLSPNEKRYLDYMQKGDDFMKIEIYRSAKECYSNALGLSPDNQLAKSKLADCNRLLQLEKKRIISIVSLIAIIAIVLVICL